MSMLGDDLNIRGVRADSPEGRGRLLVEDVKGDLEKLREDQRGRYKLEKGDDVKQIRKAILSRG